MVKTLEINLLSGIKPTPEEKRVSRKIRIWGMGVLIGYVILVGGIFIFGAVLSFQKNQIKGKVAALEQQIKTEERKESLEVALRGRISEVGKIIKERTGYSSLVTKVLNLGLSGISFQEFDFSKGKIKVSGEAANILVLADFLEKLKNEADFPSVYLDSFSRTKTGIYSFVLEIDFEK